MDMDMDMDMGIPTMMVMITVSVTGIMEKLSTVMLMVADMGAVMIKDMYTMRIAQVLSYVLTSFIVRN